VLKGTEWRWAKIFVLPNMFEGAVPIKWYQHCLCACRVCLCLFGMLCMSEKIEEDNIW